LYRVLNDIFQKLSEGELEIVDARPIETKEIIRFKMHKKKGESRIIQEDKTIGYSSSKKILLWV